MVPEGKCELSELSEWMSTDDEHSRTWPLGNDPLPSQSRQRSTDALWIANPSLLLLIMSIADVCAAWVLIPRVPPCAPGSGGRIPPADHLGCWLPISSFYEVACSRM